MDIVTYFFRRIFTIIKEKGFQSLISTNTIAQGDSRVAGLEYILKNGGSINFAIKSIKWPGLAAVEVSLITIFKGDFNSKYFRKDKEFSFINSYLNFGEELFPFQIFANKGQSFMGSIPLGMGFLLNSAEVRHLVTINNANQKVIFPYLNGEDLNNNYNQKSDRWIINFYDWEIEFCKKNFPECFEIVERLVKPERDIQKDKGYREKWWQFGRRGVELYKSIKSLPKIIVVARTSKTLGVFFS
ncbi:MAG: hypothetical protein IPN57_07880 [Ignavibacteria bacterium]|nr:hypothetical protein [Ignavibacteria bacterium]